MGGPSCVVRAPQRRSAAVVAARLVPPAMCRDVDATRIRTRRPMGRGVPRTCQRRRGPGDASAGRRRRTARDGTWVQLLPPVDRRSHLAQRHTLRPRRRAHADSHPDQDRSPAGGRRPTRRVPTRSARRSRASPRPPRRSGPATLVSPSSRRWLAHIGSRSLPLPDRSVGAVPDRWWPTSARPTVPIPRPPGGVRDRQVDPTVRHHGPLVSVVIPSYQRERAVVDAVRSVLDQSFTDLEVLVVDDASTDGTVAAVEGLGDDRVRVLRQAQNQGAGAARNRAMREARGRYVAFLDSDDVWLPDKLALQVAAFEAAPEAIGLIYGGTEVVDAHGVITRTSPSERGDLYRQLLARNVLHGGGSNVMIRRSVIASVGWFDESFAAIEDYDYWLRIARMYDCRLRRRSRLSLSRRHRPTGRSAPFPRRCGELPGSRALLRQTRPPDASSRRRCGLPRRHESTAPPPPRWRRRRTPQCVAGDSTGSDVRSGMVACIPAVGPVRPSRGRATNSSPPSSSRSSRVAALGTAVLVDLADAGRRCPGRVRRDGPIAPAGRSSRRRGPLRAGPGCAGHRARAFPTFGGVAGCAARSRRFEAGHGWPGPWLRIGPTS